MIYSENIKWGKRGEVEFTDKHGNSLTLREAMKKAEIRVFNWWFDLKLFFLHLISLHLPLWSLRKVAFLAGGLKIGKGSTIHMGCKFFEPGNIIIGEDTIIGDRAFLDGRDTLKIGSHVDIASEVMIYNSEHDIDSPTFEARSEKVYIGDYAFIGPRAILLPGVTLGKGAIVAAGAVVSKSVPDYQIVAGVPAAKIGTRKNQILKYRLGRARLFQ